MTLFLVICVAGMICFLVFLVHVPVPGRKSSFSAHGPVIHKIPAAKADVSNVDRLYSSTSNERWRILLRPAATSQVLSRFGGRRPVVLIAQALGTELRPNLT